MRPVDRTLEALRTAANYVEALQAEIDARDRIIALGAVPDLIVDLVEITRRPPTWHLGHLSAEAFERVHKRLGASVSPCVHVHDDGARFLTLQENCGGLVIMAQTTAPPPAEETETVSAEQP